MASAAPVTSLPTIPSASVSVSAVSATKTQSVPFHCINCPAAVPLANLGSVIASSAISKSAIVPSKICVVVMLPVITCNGVDSPSPVMVSSSATTAFPTPDGKLSQTTSPVPGSVLRN